MRPSFRNRMHSREYEREDGSTPDTSTSECHGDVLNVMLDLDKAGVLVNFENVKRELAARGELRPIGETHLKQIGC